MPPIQASEYLLRINYASGQPGAKTRIHTHPGSEAFYVLSGQLGQKTPHGTSYANIGDFMPGHGPGMPMRISLRQDWATVIPYTPGGTSGGSTSGTSI